MFVRPNTRRRKGHQPMNWEQWVGAMAAGGLLHWTLTRYRRQARLRWLVKALAALREGAHQTADGLLLLFIRNHEVARQHKRLTGDDTLTTTLSWMCDLGELEAASAEPRAALHKNPLGREASTPAAEDPRALGMTSPTAARSGPPGVRRAAKDRRDT